MKHVSWLKSLRNRIRRPVRRAQRRQGLTENLEQRTYLSAATFLLNGELHIVADSDESIEVRAEQLGSGIVEVLIDGVLDTSGPTVQADQITALNIVGGPAGNLIDVSTITAADFSFVHPVTGDPMSIRIQGGDGDDTILGSFDLNDSLFGGDGNDLINTQPMLPPATPIPVAPVIGPIALPGNIQRIINGAQTTQFESVGIVGDTNGDFQSGTLITPRHVLTAADALAGIADADARFTVGMQTFDSVEIHIHPNFDATQLGTDDGNDIAIIELDRDVTSVMPSNLHRQMPMVGDLVTLVGFGAAGDGTSGEDGTFGTKLSGTTPIDGVGTTLIEWSFDDDTESNSAPGDAGGPALLDVGNQMLVTAVMSGNDFADSTLGDRGYATRVDAHADWIDFILITPGISNRQGNLTIDGDDGHDTIFGGDGDDSISGGDGRDSIIGWIGDDVLSGGDGRDEIDAGDGNDFAVAGDGADSVIGGEGDDTLDGGMGADTLVGNGGSDSLIGGDQNDQLVGDSGTAVVPGDDTLRGNGGNDVLIGGGASDLLDGGAGHDALDTGDQLLIIDDVMVDPEGNFGDVSVAAFTVSLSRPSAITVTVDFTTSDGTALAASDYVAQSGTITFAPGDTTQTISIDITGDSAPEFDETFSVILSNPSGAFLADTIGQATIVDDGDGPSQLVFLDFDSATDFFFEHFYTQAERDAIQQRLEDDLGQFNVVFTQIRPLVGPFTTLLINQPPPGGLADEIDFRNINQGLMATVDINTLLGFPGTPPATSLNFIELTAKVAAHELGHLMGLRHADSYGPVGSGINGLPGAATYLPVYPGPAFANETDNHIMGTPALTGETLIDAVSNQWIGARSAVKLSMFTFQGQVLPEQFLTHDTTATAQSIVLDPLPVPNTELTGVLAGKVFDVNATVVNGTLSVPGEVDVYSFDAEAGDLINIEVISSILAFGPVPRFFTFIDSMVSVTDDTGTPIPYYAGIAVNDDEPESTDSIIIDLVIPSDGTFYIEVESALGVDVGNYELFVWDFEANDPIAVPSGLQTVPIGQVTLLGGTGNDTLNGSDNADLIIGAAGNDSIVAFGGDDTIYGGGGRDTIDAGAGADRVSGQGGNDLLTGGADDDFVNGGGGRDRIYGDDIAGNETGNDTIVGGAKRDLVFAGDGNDVVFGGSGNDSLDGEAGDDTLQGQSGHDLLNGGDGNDTFIWRGRGQDSVDATDGRDEIEVRGTSGADEFTIGQNGSMLELASGTSSLTFINTSVGIANPVERLVLNAGRGNDLITINDVDNVGAMQILVNGELGEDTVIGSGASLGLVRLLIDGGDGEDSLTGTDDNDTILGGDGNDLIAGGGGNDTLRGGDGADVIDGGAGNDLVQGEGRNDSLLGSNGEDTIEGGNGNDTIAGGAGDDSAAGGFGNDFVNGEAGDDIILGDEGFDKVIGGAGNDTVDGGRNNDTILGSSGNDKLRGDHGEDLIVGGGGSDTISGGDGNDTIDSGTGADAIDAGDGDDKVVGGQGMDTILGGDGDDSLIGARDGDILLGQLGNDVLRGGDGSRDTLDGGEGDNFLADVDAADRVFNSLNGFRLTAEMLSNLDAGN